jgi:hypothetical protein
MVCAKFIEPLTTLSQPITNSKSSWTTPGIGEPFPTCQPTFVKGERLIYLTGSCSSVNLQQLFYFPVQGRSENHRSFLELESRLDDCRPFDNLIFTLDHNRAKFRLPFLVTQRHTSTRSFHLGGIKPGTLDLLDALSILGGSQEDGQSIAMNRNLADSCPKLCLTITFKHDWPWPSPIGLAMRTAQELLLVKVLQQSVKNQQDKVHLHHL